MVAHRKNSWTLRPKWSVEPQGRGALAGQHIARFSFFSPGGDPKLRGDIRHC